MAVNNPLTVEVTRGDFVESRHRGAAVIMDSGGAVVRAWGDGDRVVFPRSAIKPLQAIPLVETGAAEAMGLGDEQLALASASHSATPEHTGAVLRWLEGMGRAKNPVSKRDKVKYLMTAASPRQAPFRDEDEQSGLKPDHSAMVDQQGELGYG